MNGKRPPLDEWLSLFRATIAAEGITTGPGAGTGESFIDAGLKGAGANSFVSMLAILYPGDPQKVDSKSITAFASGTGTVTLAGAYKGVVAPIPAGVPYKIVTFRFTAADVAAVEAKLDLPGVDSLLVATIAQVIGNKGDTALQAVAVTASLMRYIKGLITALGDPTGGTLTTITARWGDIARSLDLILGDRWDGAGDLGTDITALIAAISTIDTGVGDIEAKLDHGGHGLAALAGALADILEVTGTDLEGKLDALYPYHGLVYYGKVTTYTDLTHFKASGLIGFGDDYFNDHRVYVVRDAAGAGDDPQGEMQPISDYVSSDGTFTHTAFAVPLTADDEVLILHPAIASLINTTYGLSAIKTLVDAITAAGPTNAQLNTAIALITAVTDNLPDVGALSSLAQDATVAKEATVDAVEAKVDKTLFSMDFWSLPQEEVAVTGGVQDLGLPSVTVEGLPGDATIVRAIAMFKFRMIENHTYAGPNALDGDQEIQVDKDEVVAWLDAINFVTGQFTLAETTREGGDVVVGAIDISTRVDGHDTYIFHWDAVAQQDGIKFNDIQMGIRIWYSV